MWIERLYKNELLKYASAFPCLYVSGARQIGKTSLIRRVFPNHDYVSLDDQSVAEFARSSPAAFFDQFGHQNIIIDEIQYAPELFRAIKVEIDRHNRQTSFILSGSQNFLMMGHITESLAGRCAIVPMSPLGHSELRKAGLVEEVSVPGLILKGGYPEVWVSDGIESMWFSSYIATYLERDIRNILNITSLREFDRCLRAIAFRTGQIISYSDIAKDVGVSVSTVREWVSVLHASEQVAIIEPYFKNVGKRLVKRPKLYLRDTGLACYLCGITTEEQLKASPLLGRLWETYVYNQIAIHHRQRSGGVPIWFWQTHRGEEVDFVLEHGGVFELYESKYAEQIKKDHLKGIEMFKKEYGDESVSKGAVVSPVRHPYVRNGVDIIGLIQLANRLGPS